MRLLIGFLAGMAATFTLQTILAPPRSQRLQCMTDNTLGKLPQPSGPAQRQQTQTADGLFPASCPSCRACPVCSCSQCPVPVCSCATCTNAGPGNLQDAAAVPASRQVYPASAQVVAQTKCRIPVANALFGQTSKLIDELSDKEGAQTSFAPLGLQLPALTLRIFVYTAADLPEIGKLTKHPSIDPEMCANGMWGTQVIFHEFLLASPVRTMSPDEADLFFVPAYPKCLLDKAKMTDEALNALYIKTVTSLPYFRRSGGRDHVFVFPSGRGATCFSEWKRYIPNSIFLSPEGHFSDNLAMLAPYFSTWKDVVIPGRVDARGIALRNEAKPLAKRSILGIFMGTDQGKYGRIELLKLAKSNKDVVASCQRDPKYPKLMGSARFCFSPRGQSSWTLRFYESFLAGCVPVILADDIELPYENLIDYSQFSIKWPMTKTNSELLRFLRGLPDSQVQRMLDAGRAHRCLFLYHPSLEHCNAFSAVLHQLQHKVRRFHQSREVFWQQSGRYVDREGHDMSLWRPPFLTKDIHTPAPTKGFPAKYGTATICRSTDTGITCKADSLPVKKCSVS